MTTQGRDQPNPSVPAARAPRVSAVMANRNGAGHIAAAVRSVLRQTLSDLELIVVDDASTDDSVSRIEALAREDARILLLRSETGGGPGTARNRALDIARGDWVAVIDADDLFHPRRLERLVGLAEERGVPVIADDLIHFSTDAPAPARRLLGTAELRGSQEVSLAGLLAPLFAGGPNHLGYVKPVIRRSALADLRYRADLRVGEDFDLLLRLAAAGHDLTVVPEAWYLYRRHAASVSHRLDPEAAAAMVRAMEELAAGLAPLPPDLAGLFRARIARMSRTARREAAVAALKRRDPADFAARLFRDPAAAVSALKSAALALSRRPRPSPPAPSDLVLVPPGADAPSLPRSWHAMTLSPVGEMGPDARARLVAAAADPSCTLHLLGDAGADIEGFLPEPGRALRYAAPTNPLVHVRTTAYRRPDALRRALEGLRAQTVSDWVCDVHDDDPDRSGKAVVEALGDPRIRYTANSPRRFASRNLDRCFSRFNPHGAEYFCVLEDDNQVLPRFFEENIRICETRGVEIVLRNQFVEHDAGTAQARLGRSGLLDAKFVEGLYPAETFRLSVLADMGVSNGGLFWSRRAASDLEIGMECSATLQEYLRTVAISEPVWVAMEPLAVWAENGADTGRDLGETAGWFLRELKLKRSVQHLQRHVWATASDEARAAFLEGSAFRYPEAMRATGLVKSLCRIDGRGALGPREMARLALRGAAIHLLGRPMSGLDQFLAARI